MKKNKRIKNNNCVICDNKINRAKDRYVNLRDYNLGKFESECFYHLDCWKNRFVITQEKIQQQADEWMKGIRGVAIKLKEEGVIQ
jgi:hypothetical protein